MTGTEMSVFNGIMIALLMFVLLGLIVFAAVSVICLIIFVKKDNRGEKATVPAVIAAIALCLTAFNLIFTLYLGALTVGVNVSTDILEEEILYEEGTYFID